MLIFVVFFSGCDSNPSPDLARQFGQAIESFENAKSADDYLKTAAIYQELLDRGIVSGAILYNQGNAYMRAGQRGRAIACYRRAIMYRPADPELRANLTLAQRDTIPSSPHSMLNYVFFWRDTISYPGKLHATAILASLAFAIGLVNVFVPHSLIRRLAGVLLVVTFAMGGSALDDWIRYDRTQHGVIVAKEVIARKGNAVSYDPAFTTPLSEGTEFRIIERRGIWLHIQLHGGQQGWVSEESTVMY